MKKTTILGLGVLLLASCSETAPSTEKILSEVKECLRIYTSEYQVNKVIIHEDEKRIAGTLMGMDVNVGIAGTDRLIAIPIEGVLKGYVDMEQLTADNIKKSGDKIEVTMPEPKIALVSTSINHKDIVESVSLLRGAFDDKELTKIQQQGRDSLIASVPRLGILPQVKKTSERTMVSLLQSFGYEKENISIVFKKDLESMSAADVKEMIVEGTK